MQGRLKREETTKLVRRTYLAVFEGRLGGIVPKTSSGYTIWEKREARKLVVDQVRERKRQIKV